MTPPAPIINVDAIFQLGSVWGDPPGIPRPQIVFNIVWKGSLAHRATSQHWEGAEGGWRGRGRGRQPAISAHRPIHITDLAKIYDQD